MATNFNTTSLSQTDYPAAADCDYERCCAAHERQADSAGAAERRTSGAAGTDGIVTVGRRLLVAVLVLAAAARLYGLDAKPLWFDETLSWRLQGFPLTMMIERTGAEATVHPPLYFAVLHCWTRCFGDSAFSLRFPSAVFGVLSAWAMYLLGRDLAALSVAGEDRSRSVFGGLLAACLLAVSPYHIHAAHQVRPYTLGIFLAVLSTWLLLRALTGRTRGAVIRSWLAYALTAVAFCYTHNVALFSLLAQGILATAVTARARPRPPASVPADPAWLVGVSRRWACVAAGLIMLCYLPWIPKVYAQSEKLRTCWSRPLNASDLVRQPAAALVATADSLPEESLPFAVGAYGVLLVVLVIAARGGGRAGVLILLMGVLPPLLILAYSTQSTRSIFSPRYFAFAQPFWLLAFVLVACRAADRPLRYGLAVLTLFWSVAACAEQWSMVGGQHQPGMPAAAEYIRTQRTDAEPVIAESVEVLLKLLYYSDGSFRPCLPVESLEQQHLSWAPQLVDEDFATREQILEGEPQGVWVVSSGFYGHLPSARLPLTPDFRREGAARFQQDMYWEHPIQVQHYRRE